MDNIILKLENEPLQKGTNINWTWKKGEKWVILGGKRLRKDTLSGAAGRESRQRGPECLV